MWHLPNNLDDNLFYQTLREEHDSHIKVVLLDTEFNEVEGGTIFSADETNEVTNFISSGNIDVDTTRGVRRTAELTLLNPTSEFTPSTEDFDPEGPWVGKVYLNRLVRIYRGVHVNGRQLSVPVGTFMIDIADVLVENNMSLVNLTMSDLWKKLNKSVFTHQKKYDEGTTYNEIIRDFLSAAGVALTGRHGANLDNLSGRSNNEKKIHKNMKFESGTSRGDKLKELAIKWDIDMYFDPLGRFISQDRRDAKDKAVEWSFYSSDNRRGMLINIKRSFNDDNLYNHVVVIGTGNDKNVVRAERKDNDPRSKTRIGLIGDRVHMIESDKIDKEHEANKALNRAWKLRFQLLETMEAQVICNPGLEGDDVIRITEKDKAKVDGTYRLQRFNVPLVTALQTVQMTNIIREEDL
jgi:hypothetical protein